MVTLLTCIREAAVSKMVGARSSEICLFSWQDVPDYARTGSCQIMFSSFFTCHRTVRVNVIGVTDCFVK
jgi:hypothetical protein